MLIEPNSAPLTSQLSAMGVTPASGKPTSRRFGAGIARLDEFFSGGLPLGAVTEWGAPLGHGGREVLLAWLARLTRPSQGRPHAEPPTAPPAWALWVYSRPQLDVYPPAWQARGVDLSRLRFACAASPVADLKPVLLSPFFRIVIFDAPQRFSAEDCAFLARQARINDQIVVVVRDALLGPRQGNVWARLRLNSWYDAPSRQYRLSVVRGLPPRQLTLSESDLRCGTRADDAASEVGPFGALGSPGGLRASHAGSTSFSHDTYAQQA